MDSRAEKEKPVGDADAASSPRMEPQSQTKNPPTPISEPVEQQQQHRPQSATTMEEAPKLMNVATSAPGKKGTEISQAVRFKSTVEEIDPVEPPAALDQSQSEAESQSPSQNQDQSQSQNEMQRQTDPDSTTTRYEHGPSIEVPGGPELTPEQLHALSGSLLGARLQEQRMKGYSFEPFSLPASRLPSSEETSADATPSNTNSSAAMGRISPRASPHPDMASPPLTPSESSSLAAHNPVNIATSPNSSSNNNNNISPNHSRPADLNTNRNTNINMNNGHHGSFDSQAITPQASSHDSNPASPRLQLPHRPASAENISQKSTAVEEQNNQQNGNVVLGHRKGMFSIGPRGDSLPVSRESSPSRHSASQFYSRPFTPAGDLNDPYAASKRTPQPRNATQIDPRFVFTRKKGRSPVSSSTNSLARTEKSKPEKRHSSFLAILTKSNNELLPPSTGEVSPHSRQSSMADLKRFFRPSSRIKKSVSPSIIGGKAGSIKSHGVPFADDHGLSSKYGKIGRVLGSGAGGQVRLMRRSEDGTVFAVKEFRPRHTYETEKEYVKKLTAEFCVGSALHHGNIIETLDIVQEKGKWYEVMEYAPFDLFAIVMTGRMSKAEVTCCFLQILSGVTYLHSMGLAHRDLKLDNVVVSENGIMKIIDFGSAHVFKYPFESDISLASGIVGSDPYLAPEVYDERKYDPQAVDIWSLAIIYCCMSLRRFPWKVPRLTDNSYKLFASEPTPGHDPRKLVLPSRSTILLTEEMARELFADEDQNKQKSVRTESTRLENGSPSERRDQQPPVKEVIRGPWRLLRLLPRESRHIIWRMLTIDPRQRAKMEEILEEPWVSDTIICRQVGPGQVIHAEDHTHILEPPQTHK